MNTTAIENVNEKKTIVITTKNPDDGRIQCVEKVIYEICTGHKSEYYTLWKTTIVDMRRRNSSGEIIDETRLSSSGNNMDYHVRDGFVKNLSKTKEGAIKALEKMGIDVYNWSVDDLDHDSKTLTKFGATFKHKVRRSGEDAVDFFYALATP